MGADIFGKLHEECGVFGIYMPVSYTHLDVYKRQVIYRAGDIDAVRVWDERVHEAVLLYQRPILAGDEARANIFLGAGQLQVLQYLPRARELHDAERCIPALEQQHAADSRDFDDVIYLKACLLYTSRCV